jgi:DNA-binding NarL/FixJ family response regulator
MTSRELVGAAAHQAFPGACWSCGCVAAVSRRHSITVGESRQQRQGGRGLAVAPRATITDTVNLIVQRSPARLTSREREVLALVAAGISNKGIARELQVSPNTVKFHIAAILDKLDAATRAEAVVAALRRGELSL